MVKMALNAYVENEFCQSPPNTVIVDFDPQEMLDFIKKTEGLDNLSHIVFHDYSAKYIETVLLDDDDCMMELDDDFEIADDDSVRMDGGYLDVYEHQVSWHSYIKHTDVRVSSEPLSKEWLEERCRK